MAASDYVHLTVDEIVKETDKALLLRIGEEEYWCPLSQIADPDDYREGQKDVSMSVKEWWAKKEGLEGEA